MPTLPAPDDKQFTPVPQGNHIAVCYRVIDLGTQQGEWKGKITHRRKLLISWEIPDEKMEDGRPFTIGQKFTWSMSENATLRQILESWRGKAFTEADFGPQGFDIMNIIGVGCMLNVVHAHRNGKTYANIASVAKLPKGITAPGPTNARNYVWLSKEEFIQQNFDNLTEGLKALITQSPEYKALADSEHTVGNGEPRTLEDMDAEAVPF